MPLHIDKPDAKELNNRFILGQIIDHVKELVEDFPGVDISELRKQLVNVQDHRFEPETQIRGFLRAFRHTPVFSHAFEELSDRTKSQLEAFMEGKSAEDVIGHAKFFYPAPSPAVKHHFRLLDFFKSLKKRSGPGEETDTAALAKAQGLPIIYEDKARTKIMEVYSSHPFDNWGLSVQNVPLYTFVPTTVLGLQNLVLFAKVNNLRVRCSGYRHSWSPIFSEEREIVVSLLNLHQVTHIPDSSSIDPFPASVKDNELKTIELDPVGVQADAGKKLVRVGVAVTNEEFRRWAIAQNSWSLPMDVILVEVTFGGVNGPICHGAGRRHKTISDQVRMIEYVDPNGKVQVITNPSHLRAAAGCFGLLGIVTHITLELDSMSYAIMAPRKPDICLAIPPLSETDIPNALRRGRTWTGDEISAAVRDFESRAANDYYSEWFWFTYQQTAWVNTWNETPKQPAGVSEYPSAFETWLQWVQGWLAQVVTNTEFFKAIPGYWQAQLLATLGMAALPPTLFEDKEPEIKTYLPDALHFRRGVQNMRVRDMEFQIPIPSSKNDPEKPDWSIVRRAWWDVIKLVYAYSSPEAGDPSKCETPMRLTLELRIMADSDMILAPQRGNKHGTASIEVLSIPDSVTDGEWIDFIQKVSDLWMSYDDADGKKLNVRPHWAKEWVDVTMGGMPAKEYLQKVAYKEAIPEFREMLKDIGRLQGWTLDELKGRFSNNLWDEIIYS
ncbi:hypothetical protein GJ744_006980 [Endocarpon pusillum]|uniref:FAD-binding PCMH-type domain-containing protein n=1 Tax=Endocarpon pusillum TaxID=364733 RepID=A0A8H7A732_9EURO|nr:hypothetical protein GJ744_006980 [Endocarpon pusillum]